MFNQRKFQFLEGEFNMKVIFMISFLIILLISFASPTSAHRLVIQPVEPGTIKVIYDDGSFSTRTVITVFNEKGIEVANGTLDSEGNFHYDVKIAKFFVANDGLGHRTEWTVGHDVVYISDPHRWITAGIVIIICIIISLYFSMKTKKRNAIYS